MKCMKWEWFHVGRYITLRLAEARASREHSFWT